LGIKGVGQGVVEEIIAERTRRGPFASLYAFIERIDKTKVGKKVIEILIEAGAFDFSGWQRDAMRESVEAMFEMASRDQKEASLGVLNLFSLIETNEKPFQAPPPVLRPSSKMQILQREKELLGLYLTGHPMDSYKDALQRISCVPFREFETLPNSALIRIAFVVEALQVKVSNKNQRKFAILTISDGFERFELPIWAEMYEEKSALLRENQLLYGVFSFERKGEVVNLSCKYLDDLITIDEAKLKMCDEVFDRLKMQSKTEPKWKSAAKEKKGELSVEKEVISLLKLRIDADRVRLSEILALKQLFRQHPGQSPIELHFQAGAKSLGIIHIDASWGVKADSFFKEKLLSLAHNIKPLA